MTTDEIRHLAERIELAAYRRDYALVRKLESFAPSWNSDRMQVDAEVRRIAAERRQAKSPTYFN